jgi:serine/threonine protein kinase
LGCLLFEMLFGSPLFEGKDDSDQLMKIVHVLGKRIKQWICHENVGTPSSSDISRLCGIKKRMLQYGLINHILTLTPPRFLVPKIEGLSFREILPGSFPDFTKLVSLFESLFLWNPDQRLSASALVRHPYLM